MNIVELFAHSANQWVDLVLYGEKWLVSKNNLTNRINYIIQNDDNLRSSLSEKEELYTFWYTFKNHLFQITEAKEVQIISGKDSYGNFDGSQILLIMDENDTVHFYGFSSSSNDKVCVKKLGIAQWKTLKPYLGIQAKSEKTFKLFATQTFANFKEGYFYAPFPESHARRDYSLDNSVSFFRLNAYDSFFAFIEGNVVCIYANDRVYLQNDHQIFDTYTLTSYSTDEIKLQLPEKSLLYLKEAPYIYHLNDGRTIFFYCRKLTFQAETKPLHELKGYIWDATNNKLLYNETHDSKEVFALRHFVLEPNITFEYSENSEKVYRVWYQTPVTKKIDFFVTKKIPLLLSVKNEKDRIFFIDAENFNGTPGVTKLMVVLDKHFVVRYIETNVILHDIIFEHRLELPSSANSNPEFQDSIAIATPLNKYFYSVIKQNLLILKSPRGTFGELICYFISDGWKIDYSLSFFKYALIYTPSVFKLHQLQGIKVLAERNGSDYENKTFFIDVKKKKMISFDEAMRQALSIL